MERSLCAWCLLDISAPRGGCVGLACDHVVCYPCAQTLHADVAVTALQKFTCPLCAVDIKRFIFEEKIDLQRRVVEKAKAAAAALGPVEGNAKPVTARTVACDFCEVEGLASTCAKCENGCGVVCGSCQITVHAKGKFRGHKVAPMPATDIPAHGQRTLSACATHNKPLDVYCYDCEDFICVMCLKFGSHAAHNAKPMTDALAEATRMLTLSLARAATYQGQLSQGQAAIKKTLSDADTELTRQKKTVEDHFADLARHLEERRASIVKELENVREHKGNVLKAQDAALAHEGEMMAKAVEVVTARKAFTPPFQGITERLLLTSRLDTQGALSVPIIPKENALYSCFMTKGAAEDASRVDKLGFVDPSPKTTGELFTYTHDFDNNGILHWIGRNYGTSTEYTNPAECKLLTVTASGVEYGDVAAAVGHPSFQNKYHTFSTPNEVGSWICLHFGTEYVVCPTMYTLRNCASTVGHSVHNWVLEGSNDGVDYIILSSHVDDTAMGPDRAATATFRVNVDVPKAFNRLRLRVTGPNRYMSPNATFHYLMLSGLEFYGYVAKASFRTV